MPLTECAPQPHDVIAGEAFERAGHARIRFLSAACGLARREWTPAAHGENAATVRYRHRRCAFARLKTWVTV